MTNPETMLSAGKRLAAIAAGRAFREDPDEGRRPGDRVVDNEMDKAPPAEGEKQSGDSP